MQQLSGQDAMFLYAEQEGLPQHIGGVSIYDQGTAPNGIVRFKQILEVINSRSHLSPIFRRKLYNVPLGLDRPYWIDDPNFNIEHHVHHIALPKPGNWRQLCILVARLHARPLSRDKPLWEMYVIEGLDNVEGLPPGCFALLQKVHHAAMDGRSGIEFMTAMHDITPQVRDVGPPPPRDEDSPSMLRIMGKAYVNQWLRSAHFAGLMMQAAPTYLRIREGKRKHRFKSLSHKQMTRFQGRISPHRVVDACKFPFEEIRRIKNSQPGTTINDVMLTIVAGGLRKYLDSKGELPKQTLVCGCPIDVRSDSEQGAAGNMVGFMNVALRTDIEDPCERLSEVHREAVSAKAYAEALGPRIVMDITDVVPGGVLSVAMRVASSSSLLHMQSAVIHNTIVTNVPGAPVQLYFCGAALVDSLTFGPLLPNVGLFHIILSMVQNKKGTISISFTACREMLPDPAFYADCLRESYQELLSSTLNDSTDSEDSEGDQAGNSTTAMQ